MSLFAVTNNNLILIYIVVQTKDDETNNRYGYNLYYMCMIKLLSHIFDPENTDLN